MKSGCTDCGYAKHPEALQFDHLDPGQKLGDVAVLIRNHYSWQRIEAEIAKCEVVCANCHAIRTAERRRSAAFAEEANVVEIGGDAQ